MASALPLYIRVGCLVAGGSEDRSWFFWVPPGQSPASQPFPRAHLTPSEKLMTGLAGGSHVHRVTLSPSLSPQRSLGKTCASRSMSNVN